MSLRGRLVLRRGRTVSKAPHGAASLDGQDRPGARYAEDPPMTTAPLTPVGIDVAKRTLQVSVLRPDGKRRHKSFPNDDAGHQALLAWLQAHGSGRVHACLEATGTYGEAVATRLVEAGHVVSIVNPAAGNALGASQLRRAETDGGAG